MSVSSVALFAQGDLQQQLRFDAEHVMENGPRLTESFVKVCRDNEQMRTALLHLVTGGVYGELLLNAIIFLLPIMHNHKVIPSTITRLYAPVVEDHDKTNENRTDTAASPY